MTTDKTLPAFFQQYYCKIETNVRLYIHNGIGIIKDLPTEIDEELEKRIQSLSIEEQIQFYEQKQFDFYKRPIPVLDLLNDCFKQIRLAHTAFMQEYDKYEKEHPEIDSCDIESKEANFYFNLSGKASVIDCAFLQLDGLFDFLSAHDFKIDYSFFSSLRKTEQDLAGLPLVEGKYEETTINQSELEKQPESYLFNTSEGYTRYYETLYSNRDAGVFYACFSLHQICYAILDYILKGKPFIRRCICGKMFIPNKDNKKICSDKCRADKKALDTHMRRSDPITSQIDATNDMLRTRLRRHGKTGFHKIDKQIKEYSAFSKECTDNLNSGLITREECLFKLKCEHDKYLSDK